MQVIINDEKQQTATKKIFVLLLVGLFIIIDDYKVLFYFHYTNL
jgi:hypothetical protein